MFRLYKLRDIVRIEPSKFGRPLEEVALEVLKSKYEGLRDKNLGLIVLVRNPKVDPMGYIVPGDGASYHAVEFEALTYVPIVNEVVEGVVKNIVRVGLILDLGPVEGFVHISQIADEEVFYDHARGAMVCRQSKRFVERGDVVRARITGISSSATQLRISLTMRQPFLGKREWIEEYIRKTTKR